MQQVENLTDDQLKMQIEMLKSNKEMARQAFRNGPAGGTMSDAQIDSMLSMMTPDMMRMSMNMAKQNPDMVN